MNGQAAGNRSPAQRGWDTLARRLFLLMCAALVGSHLIAFLVVQATFLHAPARGGALLDSLPSMPSLPPTPGVPDLRSMQAPGRGAPGQAPADGPPPSRPDDPGPFDRPPPSSDERGPGPGDARPGPRPIVLPWNALLLDYGIRFVVIAAAAWLGSRWLAVPMQRLAEGSRALAGAVAGAAAPPALDERHGTREVRAAARVFNEMAAGLHQQFKSRGLMVAAISHDLRTPLTRLRMRLQNDARMAPEMRQRSVDDIREMSALIDNALEVFRLDAAAAGEPPCRIDLDSLLQAMVDDRTEQGQPVTYAGRPAVMRARPASLRRVVDNLIGNALRYGERAELRLHVAEGALLLTIDDAGPGIPPAELESVFEPFYRVEASRNRHSGGTGLGLYIARELTRREGGTLRLVNRAEGGLRAEVSWPGR